MASLLKRGFATFLTVALLGSPALAADPSRTPSHKTTVAPGQPSPAPVTPSPTATGALRPTPATTSEAARYAAREAASPDAKKYQGGHETVVYVSASAVAVALAVVLLIILI
jgi:hypothetical protein